MHERLHEHGFDDLDAAQLNVFQHPGPQGAADRTGHPAAAQQTGLNHLLGRLERLDYLERRPDRDDLRSKRLALTPRGSAA